jgi:hypothetical protein
MRNRPFVVFGHLLAAILLTSTFPPVEAQVAEDVLEERPFATSLLFAFHSDPEVNLHQLLYRWARKEAMEAGTIQKWYPLPTLREEDTRVVEGLAPEERAVWEAVLAHYREEVAGRNLLFDAGLLAIRDALAGTGDVDAVPEADQPILAHLERLLPIYRRHWWPRHDRENREWVMAVLPDVIRFEREIASRIAAAYGASWPGFPAGTNRVDLAPYASTTVAYTTSEPHTVIAAVSEDSSMPWALELLFHEASHSDALEGRLHGLLEEAYRGIGQEPPRNLWHILLFSVSGEVTRAVLAEAGREYTPSSEQFQIFHRRETDRRVWPVLERLWYPALAEGKPLEAVLPALVTELSSAGSVDSP